MSRIVFSILLVALLWACSNQMAMLNIKVTHQQVLSVVPSASGVDFVDGALYAIGDNSPWLFRLDSNYNVVNRWTIFNAETLDNGVIGKKEKPDFEAMTAMYYGDKKAILIFGSGSKLKKRSGLIWAVLDDSLLINTYELENFYRSILAQAHWDKDDLNIEAAVAGKDFLYLLNRGNNHVIGVKKLEFIDYILSEGAMPELSFYPVSLPKIDGIVAGFSGATISPDSTQIIFTASVENTSNWIDDGQIQGSFVGLIKVDELSENQYTPVYSPITNSGEILKLKIESVAFKGFTNNHTMQLLMVTDSDGAESEVLEIELSQ